MEISGKKLHLRQYCILIIILYRLETGPNKLTVGKIFGGMLILENWKLTKFMPITSKKGGAALPVCLNSSIRVHLDT